MPPRSRSAHVAPALPPSMRIELAELETFIAVAEHGSFSIAARQLHLTQPSVTSRVQRLETALGTKLLVRTTRKVETTPQGARLLDESRKALAGLRALVAEFQDQARTARQRVVVAATPTLSALVLPPLLKRYAERFTDVQVQLLDLRYPDVLQALDTGAADVGVLAFEGQDSRFQVQPLRSEDVVLVAPAKHPLAARSSASLEDIASCDLMVIDQYQPMRQRIAEALHERGLELPPSQAVGTITTLMGMLDAGMGVALLSRSMALRSQAAGHRIVAIDGISLMRNYALVTPRKAQLGTAASSFCKFLRENMR